ncbi:MAG: UPF0280 family protein [Deltaproteobacteria bacterium]
MKSPRYQKRFYRDWVSSRRLRETRLAEMETDLHILTDVPVDEPFCRERVRMYRSQIGEYIDYGDKRFLSSLKPLPVDARAPRIVREMAVQAHKAGVGPMAAVAGAIAQFLGKDLIRKGCRDVIIENGGDIFLKVTTRTKVGLYAGRSRFSRRLSLAFDPAAGPLGVCTSSGTVGHSLSFGTADSVTVIARDALLADACATAVGNRVRAKKDLAPAVEFARSIRGVRGVMVVFRDTLATWGCVELA